MSSMDQFITSEEKDHNIFEQNTQQIDVSKFVEDLEAFENMLFPASLMDVDPMYANQYIDFDELQQLLNEGNSSTDVVVNGGHDHNNGAEGMTIVGCHGNNMEAIPKQNDGDLLNANFNVEENMKRSGGRRKRYKKGSAEAAQMKELQKIRNRETASIAFAKKQAYIHGLELEVLKLRKKNANLRNLLQFLENNTSLDRTSKQLKRTASESNWNFKPNQ